MITKYVLDYRYDFLVRRILGVNFYKNKIFASFVTRTLGREYSNIDFQENEYLYSLFREKNIKAKDYFDNIGDCLIKKILLVNGHLLFTKFNIEIELHEYILETDNGNFTFFIFQTNYPYEEYFSVHWDYAIYTDEIGLKSCSTQKPEWKPELNKNFFRCDKLESNHFAEDYEIISKEIPGFNISIIEKNNFVKYLQKDNDPNIEIDKHTSTTYKIKKL